jgi:hypothetical protein
MEVNDQIHVPAAFIPAKNHGIHYTGGWEGPRDCLDGFGEDKSLLFLLGFEPWTLQTVASCYTVYSKLGMYGGKCYSL